MKKVLFNLKTEENIELSSIFKTMIDKNVVNHEIIFDENEADAETIKISDFKNSKEMLDALDLKHIPILLSSDIESNKEILIGMLEY
jgi:hypothetical protein